MLLSCFLINTCSQILNPPMVDCQNWKVFFQRPALLLEIDTVSIEMNVPGQNQTSVKAFDIHYPMTGQLTMSRPHLHEIVV